ncbi:MAG: type II toxin-antitoxin system death-on-curing family toxin [Pseudomonadota bacterium]
MSEPVWLTSNQVERFHSEQMAIFGGPAGIRDQNLLQSALERPQNKWSYGERDMALLAAAYAFGLSRNHPFLDGNKRTGFLTLLLFLRRNSVPFRPDEHHSAAAMLSLAAGEIDESGLARWIADRWPSDTDRFWPS